MVGAYMWPPRHMLPKAPWPAAEEGAEAQAAVSQTDRTTEHDTSSGGSDGFSSRLPPPACSCCCRRRRAARGPAGLPAAPLLPRRRAASSLHLAVLPRAAAACQPHANSSSRPRSIRHSTQQRQQAGGRTGAVGAAAGHARDTRHGATSAPRLGRRLVAGLGGHGVRLTRVLGHVGVHRLHNVRADRRHEHGRQGHLQQRAQDRRRERSVHTRRRRRGVAAALWSCPAWIHAAAGAGPTAARLQAAAVRAGERGQPAACCRPPRIAAACGAPRPRGAGNGHGRAAPRLQLRARLPGRALAGPRARPPRAATPLQQRRWAARRVDMPTPGRQGRPSPSWRRPVRHAGLPPLGPAPRAAGAPPSRPHRRAQAAAMPARSAPGPQPGRPGRPR